MKIITRNPRTMAGARAQEEAVAEASVEVWSVPAQRWVLQERAGDECFDESEKAIAWRFR